MHLLVTLQKSTFDRWDVREENAGLEANLENFNQTERLL